MMDLGIFKDMEAPALRRYIEFLLWHYRVMDSFWYLYAAEQFDEYTADQLNEKVWGRVSARYGFCVDRDREYLKWRFVSHPTHEYHFVRVGGAGMPDGLAACRTTDDTPPLGIISELIVDPERQDVLVTLLDATVGFLRSRGAYAVDLGLPPALAPRVLERYPCSLAQPLAMIVSTFDKDAEEAGILSPDRWYISRSDSDQDY